MKMHGMLHAALVVSSRPHAKILSVDATAATRVTIIPCMHTCDTAWPCAFCVQTPCAELSATWLYQSPQCGMHRQHVRGIGVQTCCTYMVH